MTNRSVVILFGAGASYGAGNVLPYPPPLGRDLYDKLSDEFPATWGPDSRLGRFADAFRRDF